MPLLQTRGSVALRSFGFGFGSAADFELINTQVLSSNTASITFNLSALQQTNYKHLQLRIATKTTDSQAYSDVMLRMNGDTGLNYWYHYLNGNGSVVSAGAPGTTTGLFIGRSSASTATANDFGAGIVDILDISTTTKYTTLKSYTGMADSAFNQMAMFTGHWINMAAVTSITLYDAQGGSYIAGSRFSLYGVRA